MVIFLQYLDLSNFVDATGSHLLGEIIFQALIEVHQRLFILLFFPVNETLCEKQLGVLGLLR